MPNHVTSIGENAFSYCSSLENVIIPKSVTSIGQFAFSSCTELVINCEASSKPSGWSNSWVESSTTVNWGYNTEE